MFIPDVINGCFELFGSFATWMSVLLLLEDKAVKGYSLFALIFFTSWSGWNLYYYAHLNQWASWTAGASMLLANIVYLSLALYYVYRN